MGIFRVRSICSQNSTNLKTLSIDFKQTFIKLLLRKFEGYQGRILGDQRRIQGNRGGTAPTTGSSHQWATPKKDQTKDQKKTRSSSGLYHL